jgi:hypothetical protein
MATCKATRKDGDPCRAVAQSGSDYCFFHDPAKGEERHDAKIKGGQTGKAATLTVVKPWRGTAGEVDVLKAVTPVELVDLLCNTIDDVRTGAIDPKVANAVGYLAGVIVKIQQYDALVERLSAIEEALKVRG